MKIFSIYTDYGEEVYAAANKKDLIKTYLDNYAHRIFEHLKTNSEYHFDLSFISIEELNQDEIKEVRFKHEPKELNGEVGYHYTYEELAKEKYNGEPVLLMSLCF